MTPGRANAEQWRFTPSMFETNFTFGSSFAHGQHGQHGYYTPTPGGMNTVYHNHAAGDLHTPNLAFQLGTPLSMPMADGSLHPPPAFDMHSFGTSFFQGHFSNHQQPQYQAHPTVFPAAMLVHQDSGYANEKTPENDVDLNSAVDTDLQTLSNAQVDNIMGPPASAKEKYVEEVVSKINTDSYRFRWHVTLNAPTAMIRHPEEIPMTYLNKGQAYTLSVMDNAAGNSMVQALQYRTTVRISFEDEQQRKRPASCWQLWKEGRGLAESGQRGGKLQAVEYVDPHPGAEDDPRRPKIELDKTSFDSFSIIWSPAAASNVAECSVAVRFNFLSTDFSHSKGVKGIPVRLCAKTEMLHPNHVEPKSEVAYCMVKLFRDHGAERKLANDVIHVKKSIEKLKAQIVQLEAGAKDGNKRKRTASMAGKIGGDRPGKLIKHKRTWSISSQGSAGRPSGEDDLHQKLTAVQDMFSSTRPVSVLYLRGAEQDDPDLFPVTLPGEGKDKSVIRRDSWEATESTTEASMDSPVLSSKSMPDKLGRSKISREASGDWPQSATVPPTHFLAGIETGPSRIPKTSVPGWIDAVDIDPTYIPPAERIAKTVACFYVLIKIETRAAETFYRAVYLLQRTVSDLTSSIASKCNVDPSRVQRTLQINPKGLEILVDDELVREVPEGQDMIVEFREIKAGIKVEPPAMTDVSPPPLEMRLIF